jgi:hypothetical protein
MKIVGIGGEPGTGKSTLVTTFLQTLGSDVPFKDGLLRGMFYPEHRLYVLGVYDGSTFGGTDKLAMNVHADAKAFLQTVLQKQPDSAVLFEGDRLFGESFVSFCRLVTDDCTWVILEATNQNKTQRRLERGSDQNANWLKGRMTRLMRLQTTIWPVELWPNNSEEHLAENVKRLYNTLGIPVASGVASG